MHRSTSNFEPYLGQRAVSLFDLPKITELPHPAPSFDGETFDEQSDGPRLSGLMERVFSLMSDGRWRTLAEIVAIVGGSEAGVSARLRDARKSRFGGHTVNRRRRGNPADGLHEYQIQVKQ